MYTVRPPGYMKSTYKSLSPSPAVGDTQTKIISSECWRNFFEISGFAVALAIFVLQVLCTNCPVVKQCKFSSLYEKSRCKNEIRQLKYCRIFTSFFLLQWKKNQTWKLGWSTGSQRRYASPGPSTPATSWQFCRGDSRQPSIWPCQSGPSWPHSWASHRRRWDFMGDNFAVQAWLAEFKSIRSTGWSGSTERMWSVLWNGCTDSISHSNLASWGHFICKPGAKMKRP